MFLEIYPGDFVTIRSISHVFFMVEAYKDIGAKEAAKLSDNMRDALENRIQEAFHNATFEDQFIGKVGFVERVDILDPCENGHCYQVVIMEVNLGPKLGTHKILTIANEWPDYDQENMPKTMKPQTAVLDPIETRGE